MATFDDRWNALYSLLGYDPNEQPMPAPSAMRRLNPEYGHGIGTPEDQVRSPMGETFAQDRYPVSDALLRRRYNLLPGGL